jgi:protein gp37
MAVNSTIEWSDSTWNPFRGCTKGSPGCKHCYANTFAKRFRGITKHPFEFGFDLRLVPQKLSDPFRWKTPRKILDNPMSDLFYESIPSNYIFQVPRSMRHLLCE